MNIKVETLVPLCLDEIGYNEKPDNYIGSIVNRLPYKSRYITIPELAKELTLPLSKSFTPAVFKESNNPNRNNEWGLWKIQAGWAKQQVFAIDIDETLLFQETIDRCIKYNIIPAFAYTSFSDTHRNKFRLIFVLQEPVKDVRICNLILTTFYEYIFHEADGSCNDRSKMFYGGKEIIYENYSSRVSIHQIIDAACHYFICNNKSNSSKKIKDYCEVVGLNMIGTRPAIEFLDTSTEIPSPTLDKQGTKKTQHLLYNYKSCENFVLCRVGLSEERSEKFSKKTKELKYKIFMEENQKRTLDRNIKVSEIKEKCRLFREFQSCKHWAYHNELFGLATNLLCIEGGRKAFKKGLENRSEYRIDEYGNKYQLFIDYYIPHINNRIYNPMQCKNFCPFETDCIHQKNIIDTVSLPRGSVQVITPKKFIPIESAEKKLREAIKASIVSGQDGLYVIKAETGIGKTEQYLNLNLKKGLIAVPTHKLKDDIVDRCMKKGLDVIATPEPPKLPGLLNYALDYYYEIGAYEEASRFLYSLASDNDKIQSVITPETKKAINEYFAELDKARKHDGLIITTHERIFSDHKLIADQADLVIFDEDPINSILKPGSVSLSDLFLLHTFLFELKDRCILEDEAGNEIQNGTKDSLNQLIESVDLIIKRAQNIKDYEASNLEEIPALDISEFKSKLVRNILEKKRTETWVQNREEQEQNRFVNKKARKILIEWTNVFDFFYSCIFVKCGRNLHYLVKREIPAKKTIILSATAQKYLYEHLDPNVNFIEINPAKPKGKISQYINPYSRSKMRHDKSAIRSANAIAQDASVITFKEFQNHFKNCVATFGNVQGIDWLKGENLFIVGTPHIHPVAYLVYAHYFKIPVALEKLKMSYRIVEYNGLKFHFNTYQNKDLQKIQLSLIETELVQAIGRARILREPCTVTVFSNLPIYGAKYLRLPEVIENQQDEEDDSDEEVS